MTTLTSLILLFASCWLVGPATKVTFAPAFAAASAIENPILPDEWLPIKRTGSIASKVGPAVIRMFLFLRGSCLAKFSYIAKTISSGSAILPLPLKPLANSPSPGGI